MGRADDASALLELNCHSRGEEINFLVKSAS